MNLTDTQHSGRIFALSDIHGDLHSFIITLRDCAKVITKQIDQTKVDSDIEKNLIIDISESDNTIKENPKETELIIINESSNKVKFISPGWSPLKCINWLASKAIPKDGVAKNFIFFESNKNFYIGTLENLFRDAHENKNYFGKGIIYNYILTYSLSIASRSEQKLALMCIDDGAIIIIIISTANSISTISITDTIIISSTIVISSNTIIIKPS
jgi:hypothetical protein